MTAVCPSCGCHQPFSLLCVDCSAAVSTMLAAAPQLIDQLEVAVSKQAKVSTGGKAGKGSAHLRSPVNWGVAAVRDALLVDVLTWAQDVSGGTWQPEADRLEVARAKAQPYIGPFHDQCSHPTCERMRMVIPVSSGSPIQQAADYLTENINAIRRHPAADEMLSGIGRAVKNAYRAIDRMQERQYLGTCLASEEGATCHAELWVRAGAHQLTCTQCSTTHDVPSRRADLIEQASDMLVTVREASRYMGEVGGIPVGQERIAAYLRWKRILYAPGTVKFRLGDLLRVVVNDSEKRSA